MFVRPAIREDADAIAEVHVRVWRETYRGIMPNVVLDGQSVADRARAWTERLNALPARQSVAVAFDDQNRLVGFAASGPVRESTLATDGEIYAINIVNAAKRKRVGARLMLAMADALMAATFASAGLWVLEQNAEARAFYERLGGTVAAKQSRDFAGTMLTELGYAWRDLGGLRAHTRALVGA